MKNYYVYIATNRSKTLYIGVTNDITRRIWKHKNKVVKGFTEQYNISKLVYVEQTNNIDDAIAREKQIKGWLRKKKVELIESVNPKWEDLSVDFDKL